MLLAGSQALYSVRAWVVTWLDSSPRIFTPRRPGACRAVRRAWKRGPRREAGTRMPSWVQASKALSGSFMGEMYST